jgi:serpin B
MTIFRRIPSVLVLTLLSIGVTALQCPADDPPVQPSISNSKTSSDMKSTKALVRGNTRFALDLYQRLKGDGNLFFSPNGISEALAICFEGARGATAAQMAEVLGFPEEGSRLGERFQRLRQAGVNLNSDAVTFKSANSLWSQLPLKSGFESGVQDKYDAEVFEVDFQSPDSREKIRQWVRTQTDGAAELPAESFSDPLLRLMVINTLLFKASWAQQFDSDFTSEKPFELMDGSSTNVPTMRQEAVFRHGAWDDLEILELPYAGGRASAFILLPAKSGSESNDSTEGLSPLEHLEETLTAAELGKRLSALSSKRLSVSLPRFSITSNLSLGGALQGLGMTLAFQHDADFSGITTADQLNIGEVLQDARIDFDEGGTEATVVTVVTMLTRGISQKPAPAPVVFKADRPFMLLVRENTIGSILFMGRVTEPIED